MKTFVYTANDITAKRQNNNKIITVYRIIKNQPKLVGSMTINTASYKGDRATAKTIISKQTGIPMADGYTLTEEINLWQL